MTMPFSQYIANRPVATGSIGATSKIICLQDGLVKTISPEWVPTLLTDIGGTGKQCNILARYIGLDDNGNDVWQTEIVTI